METVDETRWQKKELVFENLLAFLGKRVSLSPEWTLAEFGIGFWGFGRFYRPHVGKVYGIDVEDYAARHPDVTFVLSDGRSIPLPDAAVDITVSHSALEHVGDLDASIGEIDRITKPGGFLFLTVSPLYFSSYGAHLHADGERLEHWEHLDPSSHHFLVDNPRPAAESSGHHLNKLTSSMFLSAVGKVPWNILSYKLSYEDKQPPGFVDRTLCSELDLMTRGFMFVGQKSVKYSGAPPAGGRG